MATDTYRDQVLKVEPYGIERIRSQDRHGRSFSQFTLWLGSNLTIADFALGFLPVALGLPWLWAVSAIVVGNLLGALALALSAAMGPAYGMPQLVITRFTFGRRGALVPAVLNYASTIGWFTVNNILEVFGLRILFPQLAFWQGAVLMVVLQALLAVYGHNLIHVYERVISIVLGVLFALVTVRTLTHADALSGYHPVLHSLWPLFAIALAAAFSYVGSWAPYASDYSRYLQPDTSKRAIGGYAFAGAFLASAWLEILGVMVAVLAAGRYDNSIAALHGVMGALGLVAVVAIILGGTAANALNLYSNALSAGATGITLRRSTLTILAGLIGLILSVLGSGQFQSNYENFLLLLGYWITPWLAVLLVDFYLRGRPSNEEEDQRDRRSVIWLGLVSFIVGVLSEIPFMSSALYTGPITKALGGADLAFYIGFFVSGGLYLILTGLASRRSMHASG